MRDDRKPVPSLWVFVTFYLLGLLTSLYILGPAK